jgi:5-formyltetrahydrofolate cyclo-ligase
MVRRQGLNHFASCSGVDEPADAKAAMRREILQKLDRLAPARRAMEEEVVQAAIQVEPTWAAARRVLLYRPLGREFSVTGLTLAAWRAGKEVFFPKVAGKHEPLEFRAASKWSDFRPGALGVMEPQASAAVAEPGTIDLAIVPGVAWDLAGGRLGRGGGFFDRTLPLLRAPAWGVGFDCQVVAKVPGAAHDASVARVFAASVVIERSSKT